MTLAHNPLWPVVDPRARIEQVQRDTAADFTVQRLSPPVDRTVTPPARRTSLSPFAWKVIIAAWLFTCGAIGWITSDAMNDAPTQTAGRAQ